MVTPLKHSNMTLDFASIPNVYLANPNLKANELMSLIYKQANKPKRNKTSKKEPKINT